MAVQWINAFDLPGVSFSRAAHTTGSVIDGVITLTAIYNGVAPFPGGTGCAGAGGSAGEKAHTFNLQNTEGYAFTGRHRLVVLNASTYTFLTSAVMHFHWSSGGWAGGSVPSASFPSAGTYTYEANEAPCLIGLDGDPLNAYNTQLHSLIIIVPYNEPGGDIPCDIRYFIEFEVDYDPPPPPPFWQDFIGCKEITA